MKFDDCKGVVQSGISLTAEQAKLVAEAMATFTAQEALYIWLVVQQSKLNLFKLLPHVESMLVRHILTGAKEHNKPWVHTT